ncbi:hypothetical protein Tco_0664183 [Tanacetum coccineum]
MPSPSSSSHRHLHNHVLCKPMAVSLLAYHNGSDYHISKQRLMVSIFELFRYASVHHFSSKVHLQRPIAGSQVPFCPVDKKVLDLWSPVEPNTFTVRAQNYLRVKKKEHSPNYAEYYLFGVDVFLSQRKMDHIARFLELPVVGLFLENFHPFLFTPPRVYRQVASLVGPSSMVTSSYDSSWLFYHLCFIRAGDEGDQSQIHLLRMLQILREFSTNEVLSLYIIDDIWEFMDAMNGSEDYNQAEDYEDYVEARDDV